MTFDRAELLRRCIDPAAPAIEVGVLDRPALPKPDYNVRYLDYTTTEVLKAKYADEANVGDVLGVDIVWDGSTPLVDAVGGERFAAVAASHVFEHVPNPVGWLAQLASVLQPGGVVSLAIPDKRFSFDINRRLSDAGDLLDAHLRDAKRPSYAQMWDFHTKALPVDVAALWAGTADYTGQVRPGDLEREAYIDCITHAASGEYLDVHCHVFTPASFVDIMERLSEYGLVEFCIDDLIPTQRDTVEFFARLRRLDPREGEAIRAALVADGLTRARQAIEDGPHPDEPPPPPKPEPEVIIERVVETVEVGTVLSDRERVFIERKRRVLGALRRLIRR